MSDVDMSSILARLAALEARNAAHEARFAALESGTPRASAGGGSKGAGPAQGEIASDRMLDGKNGDFVIKKHPPRWKGLAGQFVGRKLSQCSPEFLDELASFKDWQADKSAQDPDPTVRAKEKFPRYDAALARGWANRIRNGWKSPVEENVHEADPFSAGPSPFDDDAAGVPFDDIPF